MVQRPWRPVVVASLVLLAATPQAASARSLAPTTRQAPAPAKVTILYGDWTDPARAGRKTPYKLYVPQGVGPFPLIIHSHGLGGSREGSTYILQAVAEAGFVVAALQHPGSDAAILAGARPGQEARLLEALSPDAAAHRFGDTPFALDQLTAMNAPGGSLAGKLDLSRIGMSGHSFGALSTLVAVGQVLPGAPPAMFRDPRIKAAIVYSPNKARQGGSDTAFNAIRTPIMHFTGTQDRTPIDLEKSPWERTIPFQKITGADQYLIVLRDGDHGVFTGRRQMMGVPKPTDAAQMRVIVEQTLVFWRAYLAAAPQAAKALCAIPSTLASSGEAYVKAKPCGAPTPIRPAEAP